MLIAKITFQVILFIMIYHHKGTQCNTWPSKKSTGGWNLTKYAKRVLFKASFAVFWAQKEVVDATIRVQNTLDGD